MAQGSNVGLSLQANADNTLLVKGVVEDGAVVAWSKQCISGPNAGKQIQAGDRIVGVNGTSTAAAMLKECCERQLLELMVVRGAAACEPPDAVKSNSLITQHVVTKKTEEICGKMRSADGLSDVVAFNTKLKVGKGIG